MEKLQPLSYPKMSKWSLYLLTLSGKNTITSCNIWDIFIRKQGRVTSQGGRTKISQLLFHPQDSWSTSCKKILVQIFYSLRYISQRTFQKNFGPDFQIWLFFWVPFLRFLKTFKDMFMLVNKRSHISRANDVEMWVLEEKESSFL